MKRLPLPAIMVPAAALLLALTACSGGKSEAPKGGKDVSPIVTATFGRDSSDAGERLFGEKCAFCHVGKSTGAMMLGRRLDESQPAELHKRKDLSADYVKQVVRAGMNNMPYFNRIELPDDQLDTIAAYLARNSQ